MREISIHSSMKGLCFEEQSIMDLYHFLDEFCEDSITDGELSIAFLDKEEMCRVHDDFLNDPTITDVITFPADPDEELAGQICVSADYAVDSCQEHQTTFSFELTLYLVHGWLHLVGFDDIKDEDRAQMRLAEKRVMGLVAVANKIPEFSLNNDSRLC